MTITLDTNAYSDFVRGDPQRIEVIQTARKIYLPLIVLAELRAGFLAGNQKSTNAAKLQRFTTSERVKILTPDEQTTFHYAQLYVQLRSQGLSIPTNDLWIAALTIQHHSTLCTSDHHFKHLPQIPLC
jgi:tRNA(fMet)-specific endonuclease VapC